MSNRNKLDVQATCLAIVSSLCLQAHRALHGSENFVVGGEGKATAGLTAVASRAVVVNTATASPLPNIWTHGEPCRLG